AELITEIAQKTGKSKAEVKEILEAQADAAVSHAKKGVVIPGLGVFYLHHQKAKKGVSSFTGKAWSSPAKDVPKFKVGAAAKAAVMGTPRKKKAAAKKA